MSIEYYADSLVTPHPDRPSPDPSLSTQVLSAVIRNQGFHDQLGAIEDPIEYEENALAAAHIVCSQVREALHYVEPEDFERFEIEDDIVHLSELTAKRGEDEGTKKQVARCIGFTVVASECLELTGIDHWIGFANGHSTLVLPTEGGRQLNLADPLSPVLSQDLQHSMVSGGSRDHSIHDDMEEHGRSAIELNTMSLASRARGNTIDLLSEHLWLTFARGDSADMLGRQQHAQDLLAGHDHYGNQVHPSKARIFMSVFLPEEGRQMLHDYDDFRLAYSRGELLDAANIMYGQLRDAYPDLDARQSHEHVKTIVRELAQGGAVNYAKKLLEEYFESFVLVSEDSRVPEAHGDCLAIIAREAGDSGAASKAADMYGMILRKYGKAYKDTVAGKQAKMRRLAAELSIGSRPAAQS